MLKRFILKPPVLLSALLLLSLLIIGLAREASSLSRSDDASGNRAALQTMQAGMTGSSDFSQAASTNLYMGMQPVSPDKMRSLFPEAHDQPFVIVFHSKFCLDCKKMLPVIDKLQARHPKLLIKRYDVFADKQKYRPVFSAFKPVTVPILVFVTSDGQIKNVLYNYQSEKTIHQQISLLSAAKKS